MTNYMLLIYCNIFAAAIAEKLCASHGRLFCPELVNCRGRAVAEKRKFKSQLIQNIFTFFHICIYLLA